MSEHGSLTKREGGAAWDEPKCDAMERMRRTFEKNGNEQGRGHTIRVWGMRVDP